MRMLQQLSKQPISTLPYTRAARHRTFKGIPPPLVRGPALPQAGSAPPLRDITLNKSRTCEWPSPGNASAAVPSAPTPGHSYASIPPMFQRRRCRTRHKHRRYIFSATTPLALQPNIESTRHVDITSRSSTVNLCAHGSTTDAAQHANR
ncbi:hypothetical protein MRX96_034724 [Rhipicephalus microplus]